MITAETHANRRARFLDELRRLGGAVAVIPSAPAPVRSHDVEYEYRQDSDFHWLTGFDEPGSFAVLAPDSLEGEFVLFVRPRDPEREVWDGYRAGVEGAVASFGAAKSFEVSKLDEMLPTWTDGRDVLVAPIGRIADFDRRLTTLVAKYRSQRRYGTPGPTRLVDLGAVTHEMRVRKEPEELEILRRACRIAARAHREAMLAGAEGKGEWEIEAALERVFREDGAFGPSYPSIVGAGPNGCTLHYNANTRRIGPGELVLVDAGCEVDSYASDITRTWPASGRFSAEQREVYTIVLAAQKAAIGAVRPGARFAAPHAAALDVLVDGLVALGILQGERSELVASEAFKPWYMHRTSHFLGLDVHDVGDCRRDGDWRPLEPGMVLTVEPGLYLRESDRIDSRWWNIGIRIEDDILVTEAGGENLTGEAPKEIGEIEALMARPRPT